MTRVRFDQRLVRPLVMNRHNPENRLRNIRSPFRSKITKNREEWLREPLLRFFVQQKRQLTPPSLPSPLLVVRRSVELEQVQEEVEEVEVDRHRQLNRLLPRVLGVTEAEEVEDEVAREDDHPEQVIDDVRRARHADEDADHAEDDHAEQREHQVSAHAGEIDAREEPDHPADGHGAGGRGEDATNRLPAEFLRELADDGSDEQAGDEGPAGESSDADARACMCGEEDADGAEQEDQTESDACAHGAHVATEPGTGGTEKHAHREQQRDFDED